MKRETLRHQGRKVSQVLEMVWHRPSRPFITDSFWNEHLRTLLKLTSIQDKPDGSTSKSESYFVCNQALDPDLAAHLVCSHWGIEAAHWHLDVTLGEDSSSSHRASKGRVKKALFARVYNTVRGLQSEQIRSDRYRAQKQFLHRGGFRDTYHHLRALMPDVLPLLKSKNKELD